MTPQARMWNRVVVLRALYSAADPDPWRKAPDGFRDHLKKTVAPEWFTELTILAYECRLVRRLQHVGNEVRGDHASFGLALALACVDAITEIATSGTGLKDPFARRLADASTVLNGDSWNPAWAWAFLLKGASIPPDNHDAYVDATLLAYDFADGRYLELFGTLPVRPLVPLELRAQPLLLRLQRDIAHGLNEVDRETFFEGMSLAPRGVSLRVALEEHFARDAQPTPGALVLGRRVASHALYVAAVEYEGAANFKSALRYLRCSAAVNPQHVSSRIDMAMMLHDMDLALPNGEYRDLARRFAGEALDLIDSVAFDLGPPHEIGDAFGPQREYLGAMVPRLRHIAGNWG